MRPDFHCQVCDRDFERIKLPGRHLQRRLICEPCREWFVWCNKCQRAKLRSEFDRRSNSAVGVQGMCSSCRQDLHGCIKIRICAHCSADCVVRDHRRFNGGAPWLCDSCYSTVKTCKSCGITKPIDEFSKRSDARVGRSAHCKSCMAAKWTAVDHEKRTRAKRRAHDLEYDAYLAMCLEQGNRCRICGEVESDIHQGTRRVRELAIDHDHATGQVRGLLCGKCNKAIGLMHDDPNRLRAAAEYLETFARQHVTDGGV